MPAPICLECNLTMKCHRNGQPIVTTHTPKKDTDYKFMMTDVWKCGHCGTKVALGLQNTEIDRHEDQFKELIENLHDIIRVF